jgi:hypothetical protein
LFIVLPVVVVLLILRLQGGEPHSHERFSRVRVVVSDCRARVVVVKPFMAVRSLKLLAFWLTAFRGQARNGCDRTVGLAHNSRAAVFAAWVFVTTFSQAGVEDAVAGKAVSSKVLIACGRSVIRHDVFVSDVFSIEGGQRAIPAVSAYNTPASIEPCVFGAGHAF